MTPAQRFAARLRGLAAHHGIVGDTGSESLCIEAADLIETVATPGAVLFVPTGETRYPKKGEYFEHAYGFSRGDGSHGPNGIDLAYPIFQRTTLP